jgi:TolB protein
MFMDVFGIFSRTPRRWLVALAVVCLLGAATSVTAQETSESNASSESSTTSSSSPSSDEEGSEATSEGSSPGPATSGEGIDIEISGGRRTLTTMAVPSTIGSGEVSEATDTVQKTLRRDFKLSGYFEILSNDAFFFDPAEGGMSAATIDFQNWFNVNAQALVKSEVTPAEGDSVRLNLRLFDVDSGQRVNLDWSSKAVSPGSIDDEVHAFTNAVVKHFTGTAGVAGTEITFVQRDDKGQKQIFISDIDGTDRQKITDNNAINLLPSWGPNRTVYYTSYQHQNPDLWRWRGGTHKKLSSRSGQNSGAKYCDGKLALTLSMGENTDIYTIDAESGDKIKRLTDHWSIDTSPTWSPDCSRLAFVSGRSGGPQIYVMDADGSNQRRLTYQGSYNTSPDWSPVDNKITFTARDKYNRFDIFLVNMDGDLTRLTQDQGNNEQPSFSPDGRYIVFSSDRGGQGSRLWVMTSDGEIQHPVTPDGSKLSAPAWRPRF